MKLRLGVRSLERSTLEVLGKKVMLRGSSLGGVSLEGGSRGPDLQELPLIHPVTSRTLKGEVMLNLGRSKPRC